MNTETEELSMEALDCVCGGGIVSDAGAAIIATSHAIVDGITAAVGALATVGAKNTNVNISGPHSGVAPANTLM